MKSLGLFKICLLTSIWMCVSSCNQFKVCDCDDPNRQFFTLIDHKTNKNLLSGSEKRFFLDSITLFSIERKDGNNFRKDYVIESSSTDSIFVAYLTTKETNRYFIGWNNRDLDTIDIETMTTAGSCCGDLHVIEKLQFNGNTCTNNGHWNLLKK